MSKKANPTVIGMFVIGALIIFVAALLIFSSGHFFKNTNRFAIFFDGSINGLDIGAPVSLRGVKVGSVKDIVILVDRENININIEVIIEIETGKAKEKGTYQGTVELYRQWLERGLRAKLETQSYITGKLYVDLDFYPRTPMKLKNVDKTYMEIPTIPSNLEKLQNSIQEIISELREIPIKDITKDLRAALTGISRIMNTLQNSKSLKSFDDAMASIQNLSQNLNTHVTPLAENLDKLMNNINTQVIPLSTSIKETAADTRTFMRNMNKQMVPLVENIKNTSTAAIATLEQANKTLIAIQAVTTVDSPVRYEITETLKQINEASRSIRSLTDYLEQHPESLLRGKSNTGEK